MRSGQGGRAGRAQAGPAVGESETRVVRPAERYLAHSLSFSLPLVLCLLLLQRLLSSLSLLDVCARSHTRLTHSNCSWRQRRQRRQALPSLLQVVLTTTTTTTQVCVCTMYTVCTMCALLVCMRARSAVSFARTQPSLLVKPCWRAWSFLLLLLLTWLVPNCAGETELTSFTA